MYDTELIDGIKARLGVTGTYQDELLMAYAEDVIAFMISGGVSQMVIDSEKSLGAIARGVADLWNYGSGEGKFSQVFFQRMTQLSMLGDGVEGGVIVPMTEEDLDRCTECLGD